MKLDEKICAMNQSKFLLLALLLKKKLSVGISESGSVGMYAIALTSRVLQLDFKY